MKTRWTREVKPEVEKALNEANIKGEARKVILTFERRKVTLENMLRDGVAWQPMIESPASSDAYNTLERLRSRDYCEKAEFHEEWLAYCKVLDILPDADLGDHLC